MNCTRDTRMARHGGGSVFVSPVDVPRFPYGKYSGLAFVF